LEELLAPLEEQPLEVWQEGLGLSLVDLWEEEQVQEWEEPPDNSWHDSLEEVLGQQKKQSVIP